MKKAVLINIHDGRITTHIDGEYICVDEYTRAGEIISAFLNDGWKLIHMTSQYTPAIQKKGNFSFYKEGVDCLFVKEYGIDEEADSDSILESFCDIYKHKKEDDMEEILDEEYYEYLDSENIMM